MVRPAFRQVITSMAIPIILFSYIPATALATTNSDLTTAALAGIKYLGANQSAAGTIGKAAGDTDWALIAIQAAGQDASKFKNGAGQSALDAMMADSLAQNSPATSVERRILSIAAAGKNTAQFGGLDYNTQLKSLYTAHQIGDEALLNDDFFGVIAIKASQDSSLKTIAQDSLNFILAHQQSDGGFSYTTATCELYCGSDSNDTAAAIIALGAAQDMSLANPNVDSGKARALTYLLSTQQTDGGFGYDPASPSDGSSTSWGLMALNQNGSPTNAQAAAAKSWLLKNQNADGGFSYAAYGMTSSDVTTTAHAVLALLGTTWLLNPPPIQVPSVQTAPPQTANLPFAPTATPHAPTPRNATVASKTSQPVPSPAATPVPSPTPAGSVLGASQPKPAQTESANTDSKSPIALYVVLTLFVVGAIWFLMQIILRKKN